MIITKDDLQKFTGVYPDKENDQQDLFCNASINIVSNYLRYNPELQNYDIFINGSGTKEVHVPAKPIFILSDVIINGESVPIENFSFENDCIFSLKDDVVFSKGTRNIHLKFSAGYDTVPEIIKLTALRIAGILQTENNNNIGITSKSFSDSGTRTFVNTTNFDKYLVQISDYRLLG